MSNSHPTKFMLQSTFIFLKGIGEATERSLWAEGIDSWSMFLSRPSPLRISPSRKSLYDKEIIQAQHHWEKRNSRYFAHILKSRDQWRLYSAFKKNLAYLDIETTGEPFPEGQVTMVGIYGRKHMTTLIQGETLSFDRLQSELDSYDIFVTFFGSGFDFPFLKAVYPRLTIPQPHIDLCFLARRLGMKGGLKSIERETGCERPAELDGLTGWDAVRLWDEWQQGHLASKQKLIDYNAADCQNLEPLADLLYERLVREYGPPMECPGT